MRLLAAAAAAAAAAQANKHFDKEKIIKEAAAAVKAQPNQYKKDDFFDTIGCASLEKLAIDTGAPRYGRNMAEQRAVDIETFGGLGGVRHNWHRGRGRGRGGYRGGGRGGGGGGGGGGYGGRGGGGGYGGGRGGGGGGYQNRNN
jgi:hypothetical protein